MDYEFLSDDELLDSWEHIENQIIRLEEQKEIAAAIDTRLEIRNELMSRGFAYDEHNLSWFLLHA